MVIGKVKNTKIGFRKVFSRIVDAKTTATITAVNGLSTDTPSKK